MTDKNIDQAKGRVKEAAGALTGDRGLKNEGHADQAKGSLKKAVNRVAVFASATGGARDPNRASYRRKP